MLRLTNWIETVEILNQLDPRVGQKIATVIETVIIHGEIGEVASPFVERRVRFEGSHPGGAPGLSVATWAEIGRQLGVSKQSAWERHRYIDDQVTEGLDGPRS